MSKKYADAQSYHIEAVEGETSSNDLHHEWRKTVMSVMVAPGGRYRYEGQAAFASAVVVSDGKTIWAYHHHEHTYTQTTLSAEKDGPNVYGDGRVNKAKRLQQDLAHRMNG